MSKKLIFTKKIIVVEILGYVFCLAAFIVAAVACATVRQIPVKYDGAGNAIRYGSPGILFLVPSGILLCNALISLISHFAGIEVWNLPFTPRPGREILVYRDAAGMVMVLELLSGAFSFAVTCFMLQGSAGAVTPLSILFLLGLLADIVVFMVLAARHNKH